MADPFAGKVYRTAKKSMNSYDPFSGKVTKKQGFGSQLLQKTGDIIGGGMRRTIEAGPTSFNTITGGPQTEIIHGIKTEGLVRSGVPELFSEALSTATDPQTILSGAIAAKVPLKGVIARSGAKAQKEAVDIAQRILKPKNLEVSMKKGTVSPSVTEYLKIAKPAETYGDVIKQIDEAQRVALKPRQDAYDAIRHRIGSGQSQLRPIMDELTEVRSNKRIPEQYGQKIQDVFDREIEFLKESPMKDINDLQKSKEFYQSQAKPLYDRAKSGNASELERAELVAYERLAKGYQNRIDELSSLIGEANKTYSGLEEAKSAAARAGAMEAKKAPVKPLDPITRMLQAVPMIGSKSPVNLVRAFAPALYKEPKYTLKELTTKAARKASKARKLRGMAP